jgi:coenzyme F420-dependent glucose-6-phosphate dehydrogenase
MTRFGYHASHEQYAPSELLDYVQSAEAAGFDGVLCSDHFHPWLEENGHSGFAWSWLGAAMQATSTTFGTVCAPGDRYHPAVIAQASATLAEMFPDRFWLALGSGEAVNEHITGAPWPSKRERKARLRECADVIRALWSGDTVTHDGLVTVRDARLYSLPSQPPRMIGAAISDETAEWLGGWADGMITTGRPRAELSKTIDAFHRGGGEGKPVLVQHVLSWAVSDDDARAAAHEQWRIAALDPNQLADLDSPIAFAAATASVDTATVAKMIRVSADLERHAEWLNAYSEAGVSAVYCLNVGKNQNEFIEAFASRVLPQLRGS